MRPVDRKRPRRASWSQQPNHGVETGPSSPRACFDKKQSCRVVSSSRQPLRQLDSLWVFTAREVSIHSATSRRGATETATLDWHAIEEDERRRRLAMAFMDRLCQRIGEPVGSASAEGTHEPSGADRTGPSERVRSGLRLPVTTLIVARLLFHRFFLVESFGEPWNDLDIVTACVSIACKATENVVRMRELVSQSYALRTAGRLVLDEHLHRDLFVRCRERIAQAERDVLHTLNWDLDVGESVHRMMFAQWAQLEKLARAHHEEAVPWSETAVKPLLQVACSFLNEAHRTVCACLYPREELAAAALCLAMRLCRLPTGDYVARWLRECNVDVATLASALDRMRADYFARLCRAQLQVADAAVWQRLADSVRALVPHPGTSLGGSAVQISIDDQTAASARPSDSKALSGQLERDHRVATNMRTDSRPFTRPPVKESFAWRRAASSAADHQRRRQGRAQNRVDAQRRPVSATLLEPPFQ